VQITKNEEKGNIYAQLPLLTLKVTKDKYNLQSPSTITTYKGKKSIPLIIKPPLVTVPNKNGIGTMQLTLIPSYTVSFDITWPMVAPTGLSFKDNIQQFSLSLAQSEAFLEITSTTTITAVSHNIILKPVSSTAQFKDWPITINILPIPTTTAPTFTSALVSVTHYTSTISISCDQDVFVFFYAMPFDTYKIHDSATVKAWVLAGYKIIDPDTIIGYYSYSSGAMVNTVMSNLLAETKYKIKIYYESPLDNGNGTTEYDFDTSP
jgi:hypothetical protein